MPASREEPAAHLRSEAVPCGGRGVCCADTALRCPCHPRRSPHQLHPSAGDGNPFPMLSKGAQDTYLHKCFHLSACHGSDVLPGAHRPCHRLPGTSVGRGSVPLSSCQRHPAGHKCPVSAVICLVLLPFSRRFRGFHGIPQSVGGFPSGSADFHSAQYPDDAS